MRKWLERRRQCRKDKAYKKGYSWVMSGFFIDRINLSDLEVCIDLGSYPSTSAKQVAFDKGGEFAVEFIRHNGFVDDKGEYCESFRVSG